MLDEVGLLVSVCTCVCVWREGERSVQDQINQFWSVNLQINLLINLISTVLTCSFLAQQISLVN